MKVPDWVVYPESDWPTISPRAAGFRQPDFDNLVSAYDPAPTTFWGERHAPEDFAAVLTRGGYLVQAWGRTRDYRHQTASVGKAFTWAVLGLAADKLRLNVDEPVYRTWAGAGQLSHGHKYMNTGQQREVTWRHLAEHTAGFVPESGYHWRTGGIPDVPWIRHKWTGNPWYDMYSFRAPGEQYYSSAGYVRLGQALTVLWGMDIKQVLDQELLSKIGIKAQDWHWMTLEEIYRNYDFYPDKPGYGHYVDPPFSINGNMVRGGPGWVCMSAEDLARFGLLIATGGIWKGEQLLSPQWLISKSGGNESTVVGDRTNFVAGARIATASLPDFVWVPDFQEYRFPDHLIDPGVIPGRSL